MGSCHQQAGRELLDASLTAVPIYGLSRGTWAEMPPMQLRRVTHL